MKNLLSDTYFPYGSQYYRAPSPPASDWEGDLGRMAELGFNTVKFWIQWRWNHPEENRFYWDDIDRLMDISREKGLKVMLNTIVDVAPAWIYRKYPDASMLTLDGRRIGPQTQPHRQIGGLGVCLNHTEVMGHLFRFLRAAFERYSDHPALEFWNVGSEPELTQSMSEMRKWADDASMMGDMLCHCEHCERAFKGWLERKYQSIDRLNHAWNRNYASFDEAELPKTRNTFNDVLDWRLFFVHTLGENVRRRFDLAKSVDAGRHPLMCHHVFIQGFPVTSTANDPWNVGQYGDLHGFTQMDDPMMCDILRCCARGKPVISAEMLMLMGYTLDLHPEITADDIKRHVFTGLAANLKGFIFWQYRPEMLGREAPAWGLSHLDGSETPWLSAYAEVGRVLQEHRDFLLEARPLPARIALFYSPENQIFAWASTGNEKSATNSLLGAHASLYERNHVIDFIHTREFTEDILNRYQVIVLPFPYLLNLDIGNWLEEWVRRGGTLISEGYCGAWDLENGRHHTTVPGYGLHRLFGVRQKNVVRAEEYRYALHPIVVDVEGELVDDEDSPEATNGRVSARPHVIDAEEAAGHVVIHLGRGLPGVESGTLAYGAVMKETLFVEGAEVLAHFSDGEPAVTVNSYGQGRAYLIGSYVALPFWRHKFPGNAALLGALIDHATSLPRPTAVGSGRARVDVLTTGDDVMVIVRNLESEAIETKVRIPGLLLSTLHELFNREERECRSSSAESEFDIKLARKEVKAFMGRMKEEG